MRPFQYGDIVFCLPASASFSLSLSIPKDASYASPVIPSLATTSPVSRDALSRHHLSSFDAVYTPVSVPPTLPFRRRLLSRLDAAYIPISTPSPIPSRRHIHSRLNAVDIPVLTPSTLSSRRRPHSRLDAVYTPVSTPSTLPF